MVDFQLPLSNLIFPDILQRCWFNWKQEKQERLRQSNFRTFVCLHSYASTEDRLLIALSRFELLGMYSAEVR